MGSLLYPFILSLFLQILFMLPYDVPNVFEKLFLIQKEPSFVCDEKNIRVSQLALEPLQKQSTASFVTKFMPRKVNLAINVNSNRNNFVHNFKIPYLGYECVEMLIEQDGNEFLLIDTFGDFSQFPFVTGGRVSIVLHVINLCFSLYVGNNGSKFEVEFSKKEEKMVKIKGENQLCNMGHELNVFVFIKYLINFQFWFSIFSWDCFYNKICF